MRVLVITNWYPPHHLGGYELLCNETMLGLEARGHETHVLCGDTVLGTGPPPDAEHEQRVRRTLRLYHDGTDLLRPPWRERAAIERHNQWALRRAIDETRPDVLSIWHLAGVSHGLLTTAVRSGIPLVFTVCDDWLVYGVRLDPWADRFNNSPRGRLAGRVLERLTGIPCVLPDIGDAGSFLFPTNATADTAVREGRWTPQRRALIWGHVDNTLFTPADSPAPWSWDLVTTGRFDPRKGFETVLRALPLLPDEATLSCWGRGGDDERRRLERIAAELGIGERVRFGTLERDELPDAYREADAFVFPSLWEEPFGMVPVEAMACGVPVVATGTGGSAEFLVDETNCLLYPAGDHEALAERLLRLAGDAGLRSQLAESGLRTAAGFDVELLVDVMEAWHLHEAEGRRGDPPAPRPGPQA